MRWFGQTWHAPINRTAEHVETPVGEHCPECERVFVAGDQGFMIPYLGEHDTEVWLPFHVDCFLSMTFGSGLPFVVSNKRHDE